MSNVVVSGVAIAEQITRAVKRLVLRPGLSIALIPYFTESVPVMLSFCETFDRRNPSTRKQDALQSINRERPFVFAVQVA